MGATENLATDEAAAENGALANKATTDETATDDTALDDSGSSTSTEILGSSEDLAAAEDASSTDETGVSGSVNNLSGNGLVVNLLLNAFNTDVVGSLSGDILDFLDGNVFSSGHGVVFSGDDGLVVNVGLVSGLGNVFSLVFDGVVVSDSSLDGDVFDSGLSDLFNIGLLIRNVLEVGLSLD